MYTTVNEDEVKVGDTCLARDGRKVLIDRIEDGYVYPVLAGLEGWSGKGYYIAIDDPSPNDLMSVVRPEAKEPVKYTTVNGDEISVGSVCRDRGGNNVNIQFIWDEELYPVVGEGKSWTAKGKYNAAYNEDSRDLMSVVRPSVDIPEDSGIIGDISEDAAIDPELMEMTKVVTQGLLAGGYFEYTKGSPIVGIGRRAVDIAKDVLKELRR
jgi:hypothetical protein